MTPGWSGDGWAASGGSGAMPTAPTITQSRTVSATQSRWNVANGGSTSSNNHNLFGTSLYSGATITVYKDGVLQGTALTVSDGTWSFPTGILADAAMAFTATVTVGGIASALSPAFNMTVASNIVGFTAVPDAQMSVHGLNMQVYTNNTSNSHPWMFQQPDSHSLRWEVRQGDRWVQEPGSDLERSELGAGFVGTFMPDNVPFYFTLEIMWETGPANAALGWFTNWQCHNNDVAAGTGTSPHIGIGLCGASSTQSPGDRFYIDSRWWNASRGTPISQGNIALVQQYISPSNVTRGVWHTIEMEALPNNAGGGSLKAWYDGTQVVNQTSINLGYGYNSYEEFGIYRGPSINNTQAIRYRNYIMLATNTGS